VAEVEGSGGGIPIKIRVMISCPSISTPSSKQQGNMSCRINTKSKHQTRMQAWLGKMDRNGMRDEADINIGV